METGTYYSGAGQTWTDASTGAVVPLNTTDPHYCNGVWLQDYKYNDDFTYKDLNCVSLPAAEMWIKHLPAYQFYTTMYHESTITSVPCTPANIACNASSANVTIRHGTCSCTDQKTFFTVNPEGLINAMTFAFQVTPISSASITGPH